MRRGSILFLTPCNLFYTGFFFENLVEVFAYLAEGALGIWKQGCKSLDQRSKNRVGGDHKGHVYPIPYPPPLGHQNIGHIDTKAIIDTFLLYWCCIKVNSYLLSRGKSSIVYCVEFFEKWKLRQSWNFPRVT